MITDSCIKSDNIKTEFLLIGVPPFTEERKNIQKRIVIIF